MEMEKISDKEQKASRKETEKKVEEEELPLETSPYVQYKDLEDYKRQGYGTQGHLDPKPGRGPGATDAPTPSGGSAQPSATHGVP